MRLETDFEDFYDKQLARIGSDEVCFTRNKERFDALAMLQKLAMSRPSVVPFSTVEQLIWTAKHVLKDRKLDSQIAVYYGDTLDSIVTMRAGDIAKSDFSRAGFFCGDNFYASTKTISFYVGTRTISYCAAADKKPKLLQNCAASVLNRMNCPLYSVYSFIDHGRTLAYFMEINPSLELLSKEKHIKPLDVATWLYQYITRKGEDADGGFCNSRYAL